LFRHCTFMLPLYHVWWKWRHIFTDSTAQKNPIENPISYESNDVCSVRNHCVCNLLLPCPSNGFVCSINKAWHRPTYNISDIPSLQVSTQTGKRDNLKITSYYWDQANFREILPRKKTYNSPPITVARFCAVNLFLARTMTNISRKLCFNRQQTQKFVRH